MYNKILRPLYILIFEKLLGWKIQGHKPEIKKFVVIVATHTSNWDFMVGEWARSSLRMKGWYIGKKEIFVWPFGYLFRALGGFPVDRNKSTNLVDQIVAIFNSRDEFNITIAPEGTRAYNPNWKTGFYSIAQKAGIPILMVAFDYSKRLVVINELFYPTGNLTNDLIIIKDFFKPFKGKFLDQGVL